MTNFSTLTNAIWIIVAVLMVLLSIKILVRSLKNTCKHGCSGCARKRTCQKNKHEPPV